MTRQEFDEQIQKVSDDFMIAAKDRDKEYELHIKAQYSYHVAKLKAEALYRQWLDMVEILKTENFDD